MKRVALLGGVLSSSIACSGAVPYDPTPKDCAQVYSVRRCLFMADAATEFTAWTRDDVAALAIIPDPPPRTDGILEVRGGAAPINVRVTLADGTTFDTMMCGGIASGPACRDELPIGPTSAAGLNGYRDVPCAGEPPDGCPSAVPPAAPEAMAAAEPIRVAEMEVLIDHVGTYEQVVGEGSLPNGVLTEVAYVTVDPYPTDITFAGGGPYLEIRSLEPDGRPFDNYYTHGWREGVERIEAVLVFEVRRFDPGAVLAIRDVVVR